MDEEPDWAADDPEIAALLTFTPVPRGVERTDGWGPASQRGFIAWLAATGNVIAAARAVARSESGAKQLRREDERGEFTDAWVRALALFRRRNPKPGGGGSSARPLWGEPKPVPAPPELEDEPYITREDLDLEEAEKVELLDGILQLYMLKLKAERTARLDGRVIEADLCVRQLAFVEIVLAVGGRAQRLLEMLKQGDRHILQVVATPASNLLERARRAFWLEKGEADRPPPAPLGAHNEFYASGESTDYNAERDGDFAAWQQRQAEKQRLAAEAQREWEERGRREAGPSSDNDDPEPAP